MIILCKLLLNKAVSVSVIFCSCAASVCLLQNMVHLLESQLLDFRLSKSKKHLYAWVLVPASIRQINNTWWQPAYLGSPLTLSRCLLFKI